MSNENAWRDAFVVAMRGTRATNNQINDELAKAYARADSEGKTPVGALGDPTAYAEGLGYAAKVRNLVEGAAGAALVVGAFLLIDALQAMRNAQPFRLTIGGLLSWFLVIVSVPALLWAFRRYSSMLVLGAGIVLMLTWVFLSNANTPALLLMPPAVPTIFGLALCLGSIAYVASYLRKQNQNPVRDPIDGTDVRFPNPEPTVMQRWAPLAVMIGGLMIVLLSVLI